VCIYDGPYVALASFFVLLLATLINHFQWCFIEKIDETRYEESSEDEAASADHDKIK
jgi:hypothetical protein